VAPLEYNQPRFWGELESQLFDELAPIALEIYFQGGLGGEALLTPDVRVLLDWDIYNEQAVAWLNNWRDTVFADFNATTRDTLTDAINEWVLSGEALPVLEAKFTTLLSEQRAEMIATTEVTRMYAEGNIAAWKATGVVSANTWRTAEDELVCPICAPLANKTVALDSNGFTTEEFGLGLNAPPAHPRCRCWLSPVVSEAAFEDELDRILNS